MNNMTEKILEDYIDSAFEKSRHQKLSEGIDIFFTLRSILNTLEIDNKSALHALESHKSARQREAKKFYEDISYINDKKAKETIFIVGDSFHLPRPNEKKQIDRGIQYTTSFKLIANIKKESSSFNVNIWAQRFFTTTKLLELWKRIIPSDLTDIHLVIHLGLNDYVERMFLEKERLALSLCNPLLRNKIVKFAQLFRKEIILKQVNHSYTPIECFKKNINTIILQSKQSNVKSLTFINIIAPPPSTWEDTPRSMWLLSKYNMFLYDIAVKHHDINIIDLDRYIWELGWNRHIIKDKMHLNQKGHQLLADIILKTIKERI